MRKPEEELAPHLITGPDGEGSGSQASLLARGSRASERERPQAELGKRGDGDATKKTPADRNRRVFNFFVRHRLSYVVVEPRIRGTIFPVGSGTQVIQNTLVDVLGEEADGSITQHEVTSHPRAYYRSLQRNHCSQDRADPVC